MLTDLDFQQNILDSFLGPDFFTPATVDEYSDDMASSASSPHADEYSMFYNLSDSKPTAYTHTESQDNEQVASPTDSTQSADLLDLESVTYTSWNPPTIEDLSDSEWLPPQTTHQQTTNISDTHNPISAAKRNNNKSPKTATKRRNSSITSELELQIEIEESTKRAKRCTAPLTEEQKRLRRKELNRLAAQRCRSKRKSHAEVLEDEIDELTLKNRELKEKLEQLESTKTELYDVIKFHFANCHSN